MFPIFAGSHLLPFAKGGTKAAFTVKAGAKSDFFYGNIRKLQQKFGRIDSGCNEILVRSEAGLPGKYPGKMKRTHIGNISKLFQSKGLSKMFIDIRTGRFNDLCM